MQALIKNNIVFCKKCEAHNYKCIDYKTITKDGKNHTQVIARCNACGTEFYFFTNIGIESETHYVFDEEELKENMQMDKEYFGSVSITARIGFVIKAKNEEEATEKLFSASMPIGLIDEEGNEIEVTSVEWEMIQEARKGNVSQSYISDFEINEEK